jgi:hypothetical protein
VKERRNKQREDRLARNQQERDNYGMNVFLPELSDHGEEIETSPHAVGHQNTSPQEDISPAAAANPPAIAVNPAAAAANPTAIATNSPAVAVNPPAEPAVRVLSLNSPPRRPLHTAHTSRAQFGPPRLPQASAPHSSSQDSSTPSRSSRFSAADVWHFFSKGKGNRKTSCLTCV